MAETCRYQNAYGGSFAELQIGKLLVMARQPGEEKRDDIDEHLKSLGEAPPETLPGAALALLDSVADDSGDVRDLVASALDVIDLDVESEVGRLAYAAMYRMANEDEHIFAAGRAAWYVFNRAGPSQSVLNRSVRDFSDRVNDGFWPTDEIQELWDNLPELKTGLEL